MSPVGKWTSYYLVNRVLSSRRKENPSKNEMSFFPFCMVVTNFPLLAMTSRETTPEHQGVQRRDMDGQP